MITAPHTIELNIKQVNNANIETLEQLSESIAINVTEQRTFEIANSLDLKEVSKFLNSEFNCTVRDGYQNGCYGSTDGITRKGLTVWLGLDEMPDEYLDKEDNTRVVNPWTLIIDNADAVSEIDDDVADSLSEALKMEQDNSYNYEGMDAEIPYFFSHLDLNVTPYDSDISIAIVRFHCGGDPRGNYTGYYLCTFRGMDEMSNALRPAYYQDESRA